MRRLLAYTRCYPGILWVDGFAHGPYLLGLMRLVQAYVLHSLGDGPRRHPAMQKEE